MAWSPSDIDWGASAGWVVAIAAVLTLVRERRKGQGQARRETESRLEIDTTAQEGDAMLLDVRYRTEGGHTRYRVELRAISPAEAQFSRPRWSPANRHAGFIMPPVLEFDPTAQGYEVFQAPLDEEREAGVIGTLIALATPGRRARIAVAVVDLATEAPVLTTTRSVTA